MRAYPTGVRRARYCPRCDHNHYGGEHAIRTKVCRQCGKEWEPKDWRSNLCSYACSQASRKAPAPTKTCERCGATFAKDPVWSFAHWEKRRYCSDACKRAGPHKPPKTCALCGGTFRGKNGRRDQPYCSQECYWISLRTERYPVAREGRRRHNFTHRQRRLILERDDYRCVRCGATEGLECDHVLPIWNGGTNAIDNGQTLCVPCHDGKTRADVLAYWSACSS